MEGGFYIDCKGGSDVKLMTVSCCRIIVTSTLTTILHSLSMPMFYNCCLSLEHSWLTFTSTPLSQQQKALPWPCESNESHNRHFFERCETGYLQENWGYLGPFALGLSGMLAGSLSGRHVLLFLPIVPTTETAIRRTTAIVLV